MVKQVSHIAKSHAEALYPTSDRALISIVEPGEHKNLAVWTNILHLQFHDADDSGYFWSAIGALPHDAVMFDEGHARSIIEWVDKVHKEVDHIIVHCHYGISRSGAVAKFIAEKYNLPFNEQYKDYNKTVYKTLKKVDLDAK